MLLGETPEDYDKHFILTSDIDLDPILPGRKVFDRAVITPDMNDANLEWELDGIPFTSVFEGNGHVISNLKIRGEGFLCLFGQICYPAKMLNLSLLGVFVRHRTLNLQKHCWN